VKLLLDENISDRIAPGVDDLFPDSTHVKTVGLMRADDSEVRGGRSEVRGSPQRIRPLADRRRGGGGDRGLRRWRSLTKLLP